MAKKRLDGLIKVVAKKLEGGGVLRLLKDKEGYYQVEFAISNKKPTFLLNDLKSYGDHRYIEDIYERIRNEGQFWSEREHISLLADSKEVSFGNLDHSKYSLDDFSMGDSGVDEDY